MSDSSKQRIFLAYAKEDRAVVTKLYQRLKQAGYHPWLDKEDLLPGQKWSNEIHKAIKSSALFVACLSRNSVAKKGYVQWEFRLALAELAQRPPNEIYLIPLRLNDCEIPDLRHDEYGVNLKDYQWLNYFETDSFDRLVITCQAAGIKSTDLTNQINQKQNRLIDSTLRFLLSNRERQFETELKGRDLLTEKLIAEEKRQVIERALDIIHNGPLQTMSIILKRFKFEERNNSLLERDLKDLEQQIRTIGDYLKDKAYEHILYLKNGYKLDLHSSMYELFHQVYSETLKRDFPAFKKLQTKVRSFDEISEGVIDFETKRDLCRYLEEVICNVGKHAVDATSLTVKGEYRQGLYILKVQDNGIQFLQIYREGEGTRFSTKLARDLNGSFIRNYINGQGTVCTLKWEINK